MNDPVDSGSDTLARAAGETAELAAIVAGWPGAMLRLQRSDAGPLDACWGEPPDAAAVEAALAGAGTVMRPGLVALRFDGGFPGWLAVADPAGALPPPRLAERLAMLARAMAARCEPLLQDERLARIAAQVPGALFQFQRSADGRVAFPYASAGLHEVYGVAPEDVRNDAGQLVGRIHPDDLEAVRVSLLESEARLTPWDSEYRVRFPDGRVQWLQGRATPERLPDGGTLWHGFVMIVDARKRAELALQRSEESFRHFFEAGLVGMTITEPDLQWSSVNARMCEMLGFSREQILRLTWADFTHPDDLPEDEHHYARMAAGEIDGYVMDKRYLHADGSVLECRLAVRCERNAEGGLQRVFAIVEDISDRRRAERALQQQRDALEHQVGERTRELVAARDAAQQASRAKTEFLSSMSHELRTPLNAILGFTQLIELDRDLGERSRGHLREVLRAGRHLLRLINEVLDLAQVESGRLTLSPEALLLHELVLDAAALTEPLAKPRGLKLHMAVPEALVVLADRMRLKQVLLNLLSNAVKYNRPGGSVEIEATLPDPDHVRLVVRDDGPGIPPERAEQLFQPFSRLGAERGSVEGTGIGLALSRRLVELMAGRIGVESRPGEGAAFWIELPVSRLAAPPPPAEGDAVASGWGALHETLVLYVEDNPANLALVEQILARHGGVRLISADDGPQGLALARAHRPALILMDIHLPLMDGYEVLARLRADPATRAIPVVALTAQAMPQDARRAIQAGFDEYVSKPIDVPVFDTLVRRFLNPATPVNPA